MKIDPNDPRLTAYALGELNEHERAAFRALLNADPEARQEVERIQRAATALSKQFAAEPCPRLELEQRLAVHERLIPQEKAARGKFHWWIGLLAGAAALGLLAVLLWPKFKPLRENSGTLVLSTPATIQPTMTTNGQGLYSVGALAEPVAQTIHLTNFGISVTSAAGNVLTVNGGMVTNGGGLLAKDGTSYQSSTVGDTAAARHVRAIGSLGGWPDATQTPTPVYGSTIGNGSSNNVIMNVTHLNANYGNISVLAGQLATPQPQSGINIIGGNMPPADGHVAFNETAKNTLPVNGSPAVIGADSDEIVAWGSEGKQTTIMNGGAIVSNGGLATSVQPLTVTGSGGNFGWNGGVSGGGYTYYVVQPGRVVPKEPVAAPGTESYTPVEENPFHAVIREPLSTFGLDVNTASYANLRRFLTQGQLPPRDAVRIEEMLNYFPYDYPAPPNNDPFALYVEMGECPWNSAHQLALVGLKAKDIKPRKQPPLNLVFLLDISGSMADENKLPLIKQALHLLVNQLGARDRVSIVVYANNSKVLLHSTHGDDHETILAAIDSLSADGTTNGGEGIQSAYREARENFMPDGINRVILCTDGDFNVGITDQTQLGNMIENLANTGVFLNVFGFGMGNVKDSTMEMLANRGRGQYAYIGDLEEARKNLVDQGRSTFVTVAKDSKIQIEFNPAHVTAYRLIGYESRVMPAQDFNNDHKAAGAGSVGAAHTVTALYEIIPAGEGNPPGVDPLKYQTQPHPQPQPRVNQAFADEWMTIKLRYKDPAGDSSKLLTAAIKDSHLRWRGASDDFRFAAAVADFGLVLRDSPQKGDASLELAIDLANDARHHDPDGYRAEFIELVKRAQALGGR